MLRNLHLKGLCWWIEFCGGSFCIPKDAKFYHSEGFIGSTFCALSNMSQKHLLNVFFSIFFYIRSGLHHKTQTGFCKIRCVYARRSISCIQAVLRDIVLSLYWYRCLFCFFVFQNSIYTYCILHWYDATRLWLLSKLTLAIFLWLVSKSSNGISSVCTDSCVPLLWKYGSELLRLPNILLMVLWALFLMGDIIMPGGGVGGFW